MPTLDQLCDAYEERLADVDAYTGKCRRLAGLFRGAVVEKLDAHPTITTRVYRKSIETVVLASVSEAGRVSLNVKESDLGRLTNEGDLPFAVGILLAVEDAHHPTTKYFVMRFLIRVLDEGYRLSLPWGDTVQGSLEGRMFDEVADELCTNVLTALTVSPYSSESRLAFSLPPGCSIV